MKRRALGGIDKLKSGRWRVRYLDPTATRRSAGTFATKREAEQAFARVETALLAGEWVPPKIAKTTLADYLPGWLDAQESRLAPTTMVQYRDYARRFLLAPLPAVGGDGTIDIGVMPLRALDHDTIRDWRNAVKAKAAGHRSMVAARPVQREMTDTQAARAWAKSTGLKVGETGRLSPKVLDAWRAAGSPSILPEPVAVDERAGGQTAARCYTLLRTVLNDAARAKLIPQVPPTVRGGGSVKPQERKPVAVADIAPLAEAMPPHLRAAVIVGAWGVLRPGEVRALQRGDVQIIRDDDGDVTGAVVAIERNAPSLRGKTIVREPKTPKSRRTVNLPAVAARELAEHLDTFVGPEPDAWLFTSKSGEVVDAANFRRAFRKARTAIGRGDLVPHAAMRHTGMTLAAQIPGVGARALADRAGHTKVEMAMHYIHQAENADAAIARGLDLLAAEATK